MTMIPASNFIRKRLSFPFKIVAYDILVIFACVLTSGWAPTSLHGAAGPRCMGVRAPAPGTGAPFRGETMSQREYAELQTMESNI